MHIARILATLLVVASLIGAQSTAQTWADRAPIPTMRWNPASVTLGGKHFVIGGQNAGSPYVSLPDLEAYDPQSDSWETLSPMTTSRWGTMAAAAWDGRIYVFGGMNGVFPTYTSSDQVEVYDPHTDSWSPCAAMPTPRGWGGCAAFGDTIYVFGGWNTIASLTEAVVEKYCITSDSWSTDPPMPMGRDTFVCGAVDGCAYLISGYTDNEPLTDLVQEYDPVTKLWIEKAPIPTPRYFAGLGTMGGKVYVAGGRSGTGAEFEWYHPHSDTWTVGEPMPIAREGVVTGGINGRVYVVAGSAPLPPGFPYYAENAEATFYGSSVTDDVRVAETGITLSRNRPNPFGCETAVQLHLPQSRTIGLRVYDVSGGLVRILADQELRAGQHTFIWDGRNDTGQTVSNGIYLYQVVAGGERSTRKVELCR